MEIPGGRKQFGLRSKETCPQKAEAEKVKLREEIAELENHIRGIEDMQSTITRTQDQAEIERFKKTLQQKKAELGE